MNQKCNLLAAHAEFVPIFLFASYFQLWSIRNLFSFPLFDPLTFWMNNEVSLSLGILRLCDHDELIWLCIGSVTGLYRDDDNIFRYKLVLKHQPELSRTWRRAIKTNKYCEQTTSTDWQKAKENVMSTCRTAQAMQCCCEFSQRHDDVRLDVIPNIEYCSVCAMWTRG